MEPMRKREFASYIMERVAESWGVGDLAETKKAAYIWTIKLIDEYTEDEIVSAAVWLTTWSRPRNMAQLYSVMKLWKKEQSKRAWQYV